MKEAAESRSAVPLKSQQVSSSKTFLLPLTLLSYVLVAVVAASFLPEFNARASAALSNGSGNSEQLKLGAPWRSSRLEIGENRLPATTTSYLSPRDKRSAKGSAASQDGLRQQMDEQNPPRNVLVNKVVPKSYRMVKLNQAARAELLRRAPLELTKAARETQVMIVLPMPNKTFARFRIEESPIIEPTQAARFPEIKTQQGQGD